MKYLIFLFTSISVFSQSSGDLSGYYDVSFQLIQREIASAYNQKSSTFTGSKYFYRKPKAAILELTDGGEPIEVMTNYNLLDQTFDIEAKENLLKLLPNKVERVSFNDRTFISRNGKFYESIDKALSTYLKIKLDLKNSEFKNEAIKYKLLEMNFEKKSIDLLFEIFENCQLARYTPINIDAMSDDYKKTKQFIELLEKH